jgi:hypothetical protein
VNDLRFLKTYQILNNILYRCKQEYQKDWLE